mmetsp:Transcript_4779/g.15131  ORF Transcript_4779/g.15131 Transcript_4779/m.15131 type:complete len:345 (+) Transcript_4779:399-1433(+)
MTKTTPTRTHQSAAIRAPESRLVCAVASVGKPVSRHAIDATRAPTRNNRRSPKVRTARRAPRLDTAFHSMNAALPSNGGTPAAAASVGAKAMTAVMPVICNATASAMPRSIRFGAESAVQGAVESSRSSCRNCNAPVAFSRGSLSCRHRSRSASTSTASVSPSTRRAATTATASNAAPMSCMKLTTMYVNGTAAANVTRGSHAAATTAVAKIPNAIAGANTADGGACRIGSVGLSAMGSSASGMMSSAVSAAANRLASCGAATVVHPTPRPTITWPTTKLAYAPPLRARSPWWAPIAHAAVVTATPIAAAATAAKSAPRMPTCRSRNEPSAVAAVPPTMFAPAK